ncbi:MAG: hypothetical protein R3268_00100 [Acidiferrobacterales bacterium]|nr:hypothetical protein [Acidiferrobacterales bacterium]
MITQQQLIDMVQKHFPHAGETEVLLMLNQAVKEFCQDTKILRELVTVTTVANTTAYTLDADVIQVDEVTEGTTLYTPLQKRPEHFRASKEKVYWIDKGVINIGNVADGAISALSAGLTINLHCRTLANDLSEFVQLLDQAGNPVFDNNNDPIYVVNQDYVDGPNIPKQFHKAPAYKAIADLYPDQTDMDLVDRLRMSDKFQSMYERLVRAAQAHAEINHSGQGFSLTPHYY